MRGKVSVSGPERMGIAEDIVTRILACLPNANRCENFSYGKI